MRKIISRVSLVVLLIVASIACAQEVPRITEEATAKMMDRPDVVLIDVRLEGEWEVSDSKIRGAVRENPEEIDSWMHKYQKDKTLIFYCS